MLLFVYGTLRRGEPNHPHLAQARFVRHARTEPAFELVNMGDYPALLEQGQTSITGEVYEVDALQLARLDAFEDVPVLYQRKPIWIEGERADTYVMSRAMATDVPRIHDGNWCRERRFGCS